jgi:hypothetical protein
MDTTSDYMTFRGKCKEMSEALVASDATLTLVRGHYICPVWGEQAHWWTVAADGTIHDPTAAQFPSKGAGVYAPFDGMVECANCSKLMLESEVEYADSRYVFCSYTCHGQFVGAF